MSSDVWVGALTTLVGAVLGGGISYLVSRQQAREARLQRAEEDMREQRRRSEERRFQSYSEFLTRTRSFRNALEAYYANPRPKLTLADLDALLQSANDAMAPVFLVVESEEAHLGCRHVAQALARSRAILHAPAGTHKEPWAELNQLLGRATREFQNAARSELGVRGPARPWDHPDPPGPDQASGATLTAS
jgi:hypothetical protein